MGTKPLLDAGIFLVKIRGLKMATFQDQFGATYYKKAAFLILKEKVIALYCWCLPIGSVILLLMFPVRFTYSKTSKIHMSADVLLNLLN